jgi:hypothetical protein
MKELNCSLAQWQIDIIKSVIDEYFVDINKEKYNINYVYFSINGLLKNVHLYIFYVIREKNFEWLKKIIYQIYDNCDIQGLKNLFQYFIKAFLNLDHIMDIHFVIGFKGIFKLIQTKCENCKINNYEIMSILKNYVEIPNKKDILINTLYKKYTNKIMTIISIMLQHIGEIYFNQYKEQLQRTKILVEYLLNNNMIPKKNKWSKHFSWFNNIKYRFFKKQNIQTNIFLCYISNYISNKIFINQKLKSCSMFVVEVYFETLFNLISKIRQDNIIKVLHIIMEVERIFINTNKVLIIPHYILHYLE